MNKESTTVLFTGDLIPASTSGNIYSEELLCVLEDKDFSIVNLEATLTRSEDRILKTGNNFKSSPESVQHIIRGKFDAVALSNNHIRDFGDQGVLDTLKTCKKHNILTVGAGKNIEAASEPLTVRIKGKKIVFLNYSEREFNIAGQDRPGANPFDVIDAFYQINAAKAGSDYVIVIYHGGVEYHHLPTPEIIKRFKFLVDAGADCVVSHHTHRCSGMIEYKKKPILFGLGNFLMPTKGKAFDSWRIGLVAKIEISDDGILPLFIPTIMSHDFNLVDILTGDERQKILNFIDDISKKINNDKSIQDYWRAVYSNNTERIMKIIKSDSLLEYRLRKRFPLLFNSEITKYKHLNILNLIRCDSHREMFINILEDRYNKISSK